MTVKAAVAMIRTVSVAPRKKHTHSVTTTIQTCLKVMKGKVWCNKICTVIQRRLQVINIAWQTFLLLELGTGRWSLTKTSELSGREKMAAAEQQTTATRRTQYDQPEGSLRFNHVARTERTKAGPQMIRNSLRKSFSLFGHRRNWVSAKSTEIDGKIHEPRSVSQDTIMQAPRTKDLTYSPGLVSIPRKRVSKIAETMAITAVIICNQTSCSQKWAEIMRIRFVQSNRGKKCSLHWKRLLKNIVSLTPIHKDEQNTQNNSEETISMFRWIAATDRTMPTFKKQYPARIYVIPFKVFCLIIFGEKFLLTSGSS